MKSISRKKRWAIECLTLIFLIGITSISYIFLFPNFKNKFGNPQFLYIYENDSFDDIINQLKKKTHTNTTTFKITAKVLRYNNVKSGKYEIKDSDNNLSLIRRLRAGIQTPVNLRLNYIRTKEQLSGIISKQMMVDSIEILTLLNDSVFLKQFNLTPLTSVSLFLPNTYELFWNLSAEKVFNRMHNEYQEFWTAKRKRKAMAIPLTQEEVSILASIVDSETNSKREKPIVAGLYINRLKKGMPLQADPTVIFAIGDFSIRRVLNEHTRYDSPYNTYRYKGLPPGPIRLASLDGLDAVLNYDKNNYIFMCAKETFNGEHNFAVTWTEHLQNARKYQKALNERGIKK